MMSKIPSSFSYNCFSLPSSPFQCKVTSPKIAHIGSVKGSFNLHRFCTEQLKYVQVGGKSCWPIHGNLKLKKFPNRHHIHFALSDEGLIFENELSVDASGSEQELPDLVDEDVSSLHDLYTQTGESGGKPGIISFHNRPFRIEDRILVSTSARNEKNLLWLVGPAVLVASFIFPSLYLRKVLSTIFEDSLITDFLILFFTEAIFYGGVAIFLLLIHHLRKPVKQLYSANMKNINTQFGHRVSSVTVLVLSLIIPMVTMGFVWPWTGPAASATLAPYLVGIVVQFAFEQYARYKKSPSWPVIPIIFQVYRLHQLNRAAQLVTALCYTIKGAEMTTHNMAISSSLGTLLNVLQFLGVICIWSLSSFIMRLLPSSTVVGD